MKDWQQYPKMNGKRIEPNQEFGVRKNAVLLTDDELRKVIQERVDAHQKLKGVSESDKELIRFWHSRGFSVKTIAHDFELAEDTVEAVLRGG